MHKQPNGIEVGGGPATEVIGTMSTLTGLWFEGKLVIPERLKAARASIKFSDIRTRGFLTLSTGRSPIRGFRLP